MAQQTDKQKQEKLIIEIMDADAKDGLYEPVTNNHTLTAVEWLVKELKSKGHALVTSEGIFINVPNELLEQSKEMEKEQIINAWRSGDNDSMYDIKQLDEQAEQYYNEIYNK